MFIMQLILSLALIFNQCCLVWMVFVYKISFLKDDSFIKWILILHTHFQWVKQESNQKMIPVARK